MAGARRAERARSAVDIIDMYVLPKEDEGIRKVARRLKSLSTRTARTLGKVVDNRTDLYLSTSYRFA